MKNNIIATCDCEKAKKHGKKVKTEGYIKNSVLPIDDTCPYCHHYVRYSKLGSPKRFIRDNKKTKKRQEPNQVFPKVSVISEFNGENVGKKW